MSTERLGLAHGHDQLAMAGSIAKNRREGLNIKAKDIGMAGDGVRLRRFGRFNDARLKAESAAFDIGPMAVRAELGDELAGEVRHWRRLPAAGDNHAL
jgi:hypothetical protein